MSQGTAVPPTSHPSRTKERAGTERIPALDGLRGIAILMVLLWHGIFEGHSNSRIVSKLLLLGSLSWSGVDLFFVLSGFLIGGILLDAKQSPRYFSTFYARRAYRILPLYWVVLGIYFFSRYVLPGFGHWLGFDFLQIPAWCFLIFAQNFWMAQAGEFGAGGLNPTWSLAIEEQFYLTIPWIVRKLSRTHLVLVLSCVVLSAPLLRTLLFLLFRHGRFAALVLMPCRADVLSLGVLSAALMRDPRSWNVVVAHNSFLFRIAALLVLPLAWLSYKGFEGNSVQIVTFGYSLVAIFYTCCLLIALSSKAGILQRALTNIRLRRFGEIAYCTYLIHMPLLHLAYKIISSLFRGASFRHSGGARMLLADLVGYGLTLVFAKLSWHFLEQPMLRKGRRFDY
jgi:peptidoglycan/LPS O-acetylase OafA/YrhL